MKAPPGCPMRKVRCVADNAHGVTLTLECAHLVWVADKAALSADEWPCLVGPCYQRQRFMGNEFWI